MHYRFLEFDVDAARGRLLKAGRPVPLTGKAFDVLLALVQARGETVDKDELMRRLWPDTSVEEGNLTQQISTLRKALGESPGDNKFIATVARRGYRFVATVASSPRSPAARPQITVGRIRELRALEHAFDETRSGHGPLVCVTGEAGIGKSTLVGRFFESLGDECIGLRGRCSERLAPGEPHLPVLEALEVLLRTATPTTAHLFAERAPSWHAQIAPSIPSDRQAATMRPSSQERQKRELGAFLEELSVASPVVLWLDDVHGADPSTLDLVVYLTTRFDAARVMIVVTYRPAELLVDQEPFVQSLRDLRARGRCREVVLDFLSAADIDEYLALDFPGHSFPAEFTTLLHQRTEGNPLFLADLLHDLKDRGAIAHGNGAWKVTQTLSSIARDFPASIRNLIDRTIERLDPAERGILLTGCVQGIEFDSAVVARAADLPPADVEERLARLARVQTIIRPVAPHDALPDVANERYAFIHVLYHEAFYASLVPSRKAHVSGAVADALLSFTGGQPQRTAHQLALLFEAARRPAEAIEQFQIAARQALAVSATREAANLARRGLALIGALSPDAATLSRELQLLVTLAVPLSAMTGYANPEVERTYTRAMELCRKLDRIDEMFPVWLGLWVLYHVRADLVRALETAQQLLAASESRGDAMIAMASHVLLGYTRGHMGELEAALDHLGRAEAMFDPACHAFYSAVTALDPAVAGLAQQGRLLCLLGFRDRALDKAREAVAIARGLRSPNAIGFALVWQSYVHQMHDERDAVRAVTSEALTLAAEHGLADVQGWAAVWHAWAGDDPARSLAVMQQSLAAQRWFGSEIARPHQLALVADVMVRAGDVQGALRVLDEALEQASRTRDCYYEPELHRAKGELLLLADTSRAAAITCFQQALDIARRHGSRLFEQRVIASLARI